MSTTVERLLRFPTLRDLVPAELELLLRHVEPVAFERGDYLFREGERGDALYLLLEGVVVVERVVDPGAGERKDLAVLAADSLVGEMALADDAPRSASVRAEIPCRALRLGRESFARLTSAEPGIACKLFRALFSDTSRRLRTTNEELVAVYEAARLVAAAGDPRESAVSLLRALLLRAAARHLLVALYRSESNALRVVHAEGDASPGLVGTAIGLDAGIAARAFDERKPVLVERLLGATEPWESESMLLAPLVVRDRPAGLLVVGPPRAGGSHRVSSLSLAAAVANVSAPLLVEAWRPA